jgi:hypothetical protein
LKASRWLSLKKIREGQQAVWEMLLGALQGGMWRISLEGVMRGAGQNDNHHHHHRSGESLTWPRQKGGF